MAPEKPEELQKETKNLIEKYKTPALKEVAIIVPLGPGHSHAKT